MIFKVSMRNFSYINISLMVSLLLSSFCFGEEDSAKKLRTYLLLGQSNMVGWGDYSKIDKPWAKALEQNEKIYFCSKETNWNVSRLEPSGRTSNKTYHVKGTFGPEYSFIDAISKKHPEEDLLFLKQAVGGTTLFAAWNKDWTLEKSKLVKEDKSPSKNKLYQQLMNRVKTLEKYAKDKGYSGLNIESVLWVQGESDAIREEPSKSYKKNLKEFIGCLRSDLPDSEFRFIYLQVNSINFPYIKTVRQAQLEVAEELENVFVVKTSDQPNPQDFPKYDDVHYNKDGVINIGKALAEKSE